MITTRSELSQYIREDGKSIGHGSSMFVKWITCSDNYLPCLLLRCLRHYEYYLNIKKRPWHYIPYAWYWWNFRRLRVKTGIMLFPNTFGPGLDIVHPGFRRLDSFVHAGANCTVLPNVLIGKKRPADDADVYIGDNCYIGTGVSILGPVRIGNNVKIGAGAVVVCDIPDNSVVGGVPAKVLKTKI